MDNKNVIASSLIDNELARAFSELVAERWDNWDLSPYMVYLVDVCAKTTLPFLADQFNVDGLRGFEMAQNEQQQRDLIKRSIALHKYIGTPWALREACNTVGFPVIILEEGVAAMPGVDTSPEDWARFRVLVEADESKHITEDEQRKLRIFVESYKNERSHLVELGFYQNYTDGPLFRLEAMDRDKLDVDIISVKPNPAIMNIMGDAVNVEINASVSWYIEHETQEWDDGSNDQFRVSFSGEMGDSLITIDSDSTTQNRSKIIEIKASNTGRILGILTVQQLARWNAYSKAYNQAYNVFNHD